MERGWGQERGPRAQQPGEGRHHSASRRGWRVASALAWEGLRSVSECCCPPDGAGRPLVGTRWRRCPRTLATCVTASGCRPQKWRNARRGGVPLAHSRRSSTHANLGRDRAASGAALDSPALSPICQIVSIHWPLASSHPAVSLTPIYQD
jgi:hypothetical protein